MSARLKTELWVQAFLRRCQIDGKFGAVLHRGHADAGALMVVINHLDGTLSLLVPPPGEAYDDSGNRLFENNTPKPLVWPDLDEKIRRARRIDPDLWVIEIEDKTGFAGLLPKPH
jgi:hypothetical protein